MLIAEKMMGRAQSKTDSILLMWVVDNYILLMGVYSVRNLYF